MPIDAMKAQEVFKRAECLFTDEQVQAALDQMASKINKAIAHDNPLVICVLTGGIIVTSELLKRFPFTLEVDYLNATRYGDETTGNTLYWIAKPRKSLKDRTVLIVDDILDEGQTLSEVVDYCVAQGARKTLTAVLVEKDHDRKNGLNKADFTGLVVPDRYVFGYGMDYKHYLRNAPGIFAARKEDE